jgi:hypothetical protein
VVAHSKIFIIFTLVCFHKPSLNKTVPKNSLLMFQSNLEVTFGINSLFSSKSNYIDWIHCWWSPSTLPNETKIQRSSLPWKSFCLRSKSRGKKGKCGVLNQ